MFSTWKDKYGRAINAEEISGYTPLDYEFPKLKANQGSLEGMKRARIENFQRRKLLGFTSAELAQLDCFPLRELKPSTLQNGIIPLLRLRNWEQQPWIGKNYTRKGMIPVDEHRGVWSAHNPVVWSVLEPILKLASQILMSAEMLPWLDALFHGDREFVSQERLGEKDKGKSLLSFHCRAIQESRNIASDRDTLYRRLVEIFGTQFGFMHQLRNPINDGPPFPSRPQGATFTSELGNPGPYKLFTFLDKALFQSLLFYSLNSAEKLTQEWFIAQLVTHEIAHLSYKSWVHLQNDQREIYFEDEQLMELGYSFEGAFFGGNLYPMQVESPGPILGCWHWTNYPTLLSDYQRDPETPILINPSLSRSVDIFPIPMSFMEDAQQDEFWEVGVRAFGFKAFRLRTLRVGIRQEYGGLGSRIFHDAFKSDKDEVKTSLGILAIRDARTMTLDQVEALHWGNNLLKSVSEEEELWMESFKQTARVKELIDLATQNTDNHMLVMLLGKIQEAVLAHVKLANSTLSVEKLNHRTDRNRRRQLLKWGTGTRKFLNNFPSLMDLEEVLENLERARLNLWNPLDIEAHDDESAFECQKLQEALRLYHCNDIVSSKAYITEVLCGQTCSTLGKTCSEILLVALNWTFDDDLIGRLSYLENKYHFLNTIKSWILHHEQWEGVISPWESLAENLGKKLLQAISASQQSAEIEDEKLDMDMNGAQDVDISRTSSRLSRTSLNKRPKKPATSRVREGRVSNR